MESDILAVLLDTLLNNIAYLIITLVLLFLSGIVSGSEIALFSLSPQQIKHCNESTDIRDRRIVQLLSSNQILLSVILILNNFINITIITLSFFVALKIDDYNPNSESYGLKSVIIMGVLNTISIAIFGEIIPKLYASERNLEFARKTSRLLKAMIYIMHPFARIVVKMNILLKFYSNNIGYSISWEELNNVLSIVSPRTTKQERDIVKRAAFFSSKTVKQIMRPRIDIKAISIDTSFSVLLKQIRTFLCSRIPVYENTIDNIKGILYIKDILPYINMTDEFEWNKLLRNPVFFVPESKNINDLLKDFQVKRLHMAIVVDEYGGIAGHYNYGRYNRRSSWRNRYQARRTAKLIYQKER